jgi:hypothetical protein
MRRKSNWLDDETIHAVGLLITILYGILSGLASCTMAPVTGGEMPIYQDGKVLHKPRDIIADAETWRFHVLSLWNASIRLFHFTKN